MSILEVSIQSLYMLRYLEGDTSPAAKKQNRATTFRMRAVDGDQQALRQGKGAGHPRVPGAPPPTLSDQITDGQRGGHIGITPPNS